MTKRIVAPLAAGLLCLYSIEASAALSHKYSDRVRHHLHFAHQSEVAPDFGTSGLVGRSLLRMRQDGAEDDEDETED